MIAWYLHRSWVGMLAMRWALLYYVRAHARPAAITWHHLRIATIKLIIRRCCASLRRVVSILPQLQLLLYAFGVIKFISPVRSILTWERLLTETASKACRVDCNASKLCIWLAWLNQSHTLLATKRVMVGAIVLYSLIRVCHFIKTENFLAVWVRALLVC